MYGENQRMNEKEKKLPRYFGARLHRYRQKDREVQEIGVTHSDCGKKACVK